MLTVDELTTVWELVIRSGNIDLLRTNLGGVDRAFVNTTPQMTRFRGAKVCIKWLQERIDDHNIQSDYKYKSGTKKEKSILVRYACVVTLHDYTTDTNDDMTTMTVFHTEHINTNT